MSTSDTQGNAQPQIELKGVGVGDTAAWGTSFLLAPKPKKPAPAKATNDLAHERERLANAIAAEAHSMSVSINTADSHTAEILKALLVLLEDPALTEEAESFLEQGWNAETSVLEAMAVFTELLSGDDIFSERIPDLQDLALKVAIRLSGQEWSFSIPSEGPVVVIAEDLSPTDTAQFTDAVVAVVTSGGGPTSHTAIICRQRGIPALVGVKDALSIPAGQGLVVDALSGTAYLSTEKPNLDGQMLSRARTYPALVEVKGNVGSIDEAIALAKTEAKGIGLMRTELLFLAREVAPGLDEQIDLYSTLLEKAPAGEVIFRTLDAGSDKPLPYLGLGVEENPSLGVRGFRLHGIDDTILKTQLSALSAAQAKTGRTVSVMAPMISTVDEAKDFARLAKAVGLSSIGVMVETPSICTQIKDLAGVVGFVSIGTNDLSQYLFAADRQNSAVAKLLDPWQPGLLRTIAEVCSAAEKVDIKVGVCGEAASDPLLAIVLVGLGVKSLSMAGPAVARVLDFVSSVTLDQAKEIALASLEGVSAKETRTNALAKLP